MSDLDAALATAISHLNQAARAAGLGEESANLTLVASLLAQFRAQGQHIDTEYALRTKGGQMHVRNTAEETPEATARWIERERIWGSQVYSRQVIAVTPWAQVPQ